MLNLSQKKPKRGLQQLSDTQKLAAISKVENGETKAAVAREFGVPESTLRGWCKKAKLNGCVRNKTTYVQTRSSGLIANEMAYRDCGYSKGSGSDEGSLTTFGDQEDYENDYISAHHQNRKINDDSQMLWNWINQHQNPYEEKPLAEYNITAATNGHHSLAYTIRPQQGWFYTLCKNGIREETSSISPPLCESTESSFNEEEPLALVVQSKRRISEDALNSHINKFCRLEKEIPNDRAKNIITTPTAKNTTVSVEEALRHGEVFLNWLQECSDPNVSVLQAMQIATLIKNIRSSHQRNQNKN